MKRHPDRRRQQVPAAKRGSWFQAKRPIFQFVVVLAVLMGLFYASTMTRVFQERIYPAYLQWNAQASAAILRLCGEDARTEGATIVSSRFQVHIKRGCEAIEPSALFAAAVLAFPAPWRRRLMGVLLGVLLLAIINLVRIVSLYYVGVHAPRIFEAMHVEVWQPVFIALALVLWILWALWATKPKKAPSHAAD
ncbi:MAG: exosortase H [Planctomycetota bacterium]